MVLGSGKNPFRIPDPGVKKAPDPGSRIRICNTAIFSQLTFQSLGPLSPLVSART